MVGDDGGTEPNGGTPFRSSLIRIPFTGKVARIISARHALLADRNPRAKLLYSSHLQQANL